MLRRRRWQHRTPPGLYPSPPRWKYCLLSKSDAHLQQFLPLVVSWICWPKLHRVPHSTPAEQRAIQHTHRLRKKGNVVIWMSVKLNNLDVCNFHSPPNTKIFFFAWEPVAKNLIPTAHDLRNCSEFIFNTNILHNSFRCPNSKALSNMQRSFCFWLRRLISCWRSVRNAGNAKRPTLRSIWSYRFTLIGRGFWRITSTPLHCLGCAL